MEEAMDRRAAVLAMRQEGATFRTIGKELGISSTRASQLHAKAVLDQAQRMLAMPITLTTSLSDLPLRQRGRMALSNHGHITVAQLLEQDERTRARELLCITNFGRRQLAELEQILLQVQE